MIISTVTELKERVRSGTQLRIVGQKSAIDWLPSWSGDQVSLDFNKDIIEFRPEDLIVRVGSAMKIDELREELEKQKLCIPMLRDKGWLGYSGQTVGGLVSLGLPHYGFGHVRDWVLGATFMDGLGNVISSGSNVVKSVAGFDLHKMIVGSRGGIGIILEVTLRLFPIHQLPHLDVEPMTFPVYIKRGQSSLPLNGSIQCGQYSWSKQRDESNSYSWIIGPNGYLSSKTSPSAQILRENIKSKFDPASIFARGFNTP